MASPTADGLDTNPQNVSQHLNGTLSPGLHITINCQTVVIERPPAADHPPKGMWVRSRGILSFVETLYWNILDRDSENQGAIDYWTRNTYSRGLAHTLGGFVTSPEYSVRGLPTEVTVDKFYLAVLGRHADAGEKAYWVDRIRDGMTLRQVAEGFVKSAEYRRMVQAGTAPDPVHWPTD